MTQPRFDTHREAVEAGWFSRRHETADANRETRERYQQKARPAAKLARRRRRVELEQAA